MMAAFSQIVRLTHMCRDKAASNSVEDRVRSGFCSGVGAVWTQDVSVDESVIARRRSFRLISDVSLITHSAIDSGGWIS